MQPASPLVNSVKNEGPELLQVQRAPETFGLGRMPETRILTA